MERYRICWDWCSLKPYFIAVYYPHPGTSLGHWQQVSPYYVYRKNAVNWAKRNNKQLENE